MDQRSCLICHCLFDENALLPLGVLHEDICAAIRSDCATCSSESYICRPDLSKYTPLLTFTTSDEDNHLYANQTDIKTVYTFSDRCSDILSSYVGSWSFILLFCVVFVFWISLNTYFLVFDKFDPYPFILLNLVLSVLAAIQAPIILMSQNRQAEIDRVRATYDYNVNLKSEMEIRNLHEKVDELLAQKDDNAHLSS